MRGEWSEVDLVLTTHCTLFPAILPASAPVAGLRCTTAGALQDEPDVALSLWSLVGRALINSGWRHIAVVTLDKLLATACLLRHDITGACALQILGIAPAHIAAAFPGAPDAALKLQTCAWHALRHFCEATDLDMPEALFVDVRKSQASLFFGKVAADGTSALLQPPAASPADGGDANRAQLAGLAQYCNVRVCISSRLPMPVQLASLQLHLQHVLYSPAAKRSSDAAATDGTQPGVEAQRAAARQALQGDNVSDLGTTAEDVASTVSTRRRHRRHASSVRSGAAPRDARNGTALSGVSLDALSLAEAPSLPGGTVLRHWTDGSNAACELAAHHSGPAVLQPGDNYFNFRACPVHEGVHLLDCVQAQLDCEARHNLYLEARVADEAASAAPETQPFGAALVATAGAETLDVAVVLPGGALYGSCCHWAGVRLRPAQGQVQDVTMRAALTCADDADGLDFARIRGDAVDQACNPQSGPVRAIWECEGVCTAVAPADDGEMSIPGSVSDSGTLWLPVACRQRVRHAETVDIGDDGVVATGEAEGAVPGDAAIEVSVGYWNGCWRSKHVRLRVPVQVSPILRPLHCL